MTERAGEVNVYDCQGCRNVIVTRNVHDGTTPFMLACRATPNCSGRMVSRGYRVPQDLAPTHEWFRPARLKGYSRDMKAHIRMGGLVLRRAVPEDVLQ